MSGIVTPSTPHGAEAPEARPHRLEAAGWVAGAYSEVGTYHPLNEDGFRHVPATQNPQFVAVADGVGGGSHGDLASATLLDHCATIPAQASLEAFKAAMRDSDEVVRRRLATRSDRPGASTFVGAWFIAPMCIRLCHVGDCCAFRLSQGLLGPSLTRLTVDQTYGNLGEKPPAKGRKDDPARMVGVGAIGQVEVREHDLKSGEGLLLCSDGVHKFLPPHEMLLILKQGLASHLPEADICRQLAQAAKRNGSKDDTTALLALHRGRPSRRLGTGIKLSWLILVLLLATLAGVLYLNQGEGLWAWLNSF